MLAVDTNILVRLLEADDAVELTHVEALLNRVEAEDARLFVSCIVVAETAWVLRTVHRESREAIADSVAHLRGLESLQFEHAGAVDRAVAAYRTGAADLSDYLVREISYAPRRPRPSRRSTARP